MAGNLQPGPISIDTAGRRQRDDGGVMTVEPGSPDGQPRAFMSYRDDVKQQRRLEAFGYRVPTQFLNEHVCTEFKQFG